MKLYEFENFNSYNNTILEMVQYFSLKVTYLNLFDTDDGIHISIGCKNKIDKNSIETFIKEKFKFENINNIVFTNFNDIIRISFDLLNDE